MKFYAAPYWYPSKIPWHWLIWTGRVSRPRRFFPETEESSTAGWVYAWIVSVYLVFMWFPTNKIFSRTLLFLKALFLIGIPLHLHGPPGNWQKWISLKHFFPGATFQKSFCRYEYLQSTWLIFISFKIFLKYFYLNEGKMYVINNELDQGISLKNVYRYSCQRGQTGFGSGSDWAGLRCRSGSDKIM